MNGKKEIAKLLKQADKLLIEARSIAFETCDFSDGVSDIDIQEIRDALASVLKNL